MNRALSEKLYRVKYKFEASAEGEMSVSIGDILIANGEPYEEWQMCTKWGDVRAKGYVPIKYIEEVSSSETAKYLSENKPARNRSRIALPSSAPEKQQLSSLSNPVSNVPIGLPPKPITSNNSFLTTPPFLSSAPSTTSKQTTNETQNDPSLAFVDTYERHEKMFRKIMKQREEVFKRLEQRLSEASKEIEHFVKKNDDLIEKIKHLDSEIEAERNAVIEPLTANNAPSSSATRTILIK